MKKLFFSFLFVIFTSSCFSQSEQKTKFLNHYAGIQANELIKQLINLNTDNTTIDNPYLLSYSVFLDKYKWGVQAGFGYNYQRIEDKLTQANHESKINDVFYRFGIARNFIIGKKWEATTGIDYAGSYELNKTFAFSVVKINTTKDSTATIATSLIRKKGGGAQLRLGFHLGEHILLFTEASFYYFISSNKNNVAVTETVTNTQFPENNTYTLSSSNTETENSNFEITVPVAIFLIIKF